MNAYLLVDFGSTDTKLTCVDLENNYIIGTSKSPTTVETNVLDGYDKALEYLFIKAISTRNLLSHYLFEKEQYRSEKSLD